MVVGINCGHTISGAGYGAAGIIKESEHTRLVGHALMDLLKTAGVTVIDCTIDHANTQNEYLAAAVALANRQELDWFISIHFNASGTHKGHGAEVYTYEGRQYQDALDVCANLSELGFTNRGVKAGSGLYVIRKTKAKSMLIEVCFCDNEQDILIYNSLGIDKIAQSIFNALKVHMVEKDEDIVDNKNMTHEEFIEFVGNIAVKDWNERRIMLPSIVIAQAIKESGWGNSELAQNANALFGIKKNGWTGRVYIKDAAEQNPDESYRTDVNVEWRYYDNWEQSIIDHNTYIAERKIGNQTEPNFKEVVGETVLKRAIAGLVGDGYRYESAKKCTDLELKNYVEKGKTLFSYATSRTYPQSLSDYIEKYNLEKYDSVEPDVGEKDEYAPEGSLFIVQVGAYKSLKKAQIFQRKLEQMGVVSMVNQYKI